MKTMFRLIIETIGLLIMGAYLLALWVALAAIF